MSQCSHELSHVLYRPIPGEFFPHIVPASLSRRWAWRETEFPAWAGQNPHPHTFLWRPLDRTLKHSTVNSHLAQGISAGLLDGKNVLALQDKQLNEIIVTIESLGEKAKSLKTVLQALDEIYDYGVIRCVQASQH
jgi:hypothetical protein